jgi:uncharacterized protein YjbI with pentapeptide repeats
MSGDLNNNVIFVGAGVGTGNNLSDQKPITDGITEVEVHPNPNIALSNKKVSNISQPVLPEIFKTLQSPAAQEEFKAFWTLVERIESNPNAHVRGNFKRFITTEPLKLSNFLSEVKHNEDFQLEKFLKRHGITLEYSFLDGAELNDANLIGANLIGAELNDAELNDANLVGAKLNDAELNGAKLNRAWLKGANLIGAELNGAKLCRAGLNDAWLKGAKLNDADLSLAYLERAKLNRAKLNRAELTLAWLNDADLNDAELNGAKLGGAGLNDAKLNGAQLKDAQLKDAQLNGAVLNGAVLNSAVLNVIRLNRSTKLDTYTKLHNIKCNSIIYEGKEITDEKAIKAKFVELGAKEENISFAQAA